LKEIVPEIHYLKSCFMRVQNGYKTYLGERFKNDRLRFFFFFFFTKSSSQSFAAYRDTLWLSKKQQLQ